MKNELKITHGKEEIVMPYVDPGEEGLDHSFLYSSYNKTNWGLEFSDVHLSMFYRIKELEAELEKAKLVKFKEGEGPQPSIIHGIDYYYI